MKAKQICSTGSIFLFLGITSAAYALVPVYFLGKRLIIPESVPLDTAERLILYAHLVWLALSVVLAGIRRSAYLLPQSSILIRFELFRIPIKTINLGNADDCRFSITQDSVRFLRETRECVNITAFSPKDYKTHILGSYLSLDEAETELSSLQATINTLTNKEPNKTQEGIGEKLAKPSE
jgi:hypothetical protein